MSVDQTDALFKGVWWPAGDKSKRQFGTLTVTEDQHISLTIEDITPRTLATVFKGHFLESDTVGSTFHGYDEKQRPISLFGVVQIKPGYRTGVSTIVYHATSAVVGVHLGKVTEVNLRRVRLGLSNLEEWLCTPDLKISHRKGQFRITIPPLFERRFHTRHGFGIKLTDWKSGSHTARRHEFFSRRIFEIDYASPQPITAVAEHVLSLQWLVSLATQTSTRVLSCEGQHESDSSETSLIIFQRWSGSFAADHVVHRSQMLFTLKDYPRSLGSLISDWLDFKDKHHDVLASLYSTVYNTQLYSNHRFLFLAHAAELYHRINFKGHKEAPKKFKARLRRIEAGLQTSRRKQASKKSDLHWIRDRLNHANQLPLIDRLRDLFVRFGPVPGVPADKIEQFVTKTRDTRNFYTHFGSSLKKRTFQGNELHYASDVLERLIKLCIIRKLSLPARSRTIVAQNPPIIEFESGLTEKAKEANGT